MKRIFAILILSLGLSTAACSGTTTHVLQGIYALDESFSMAQELAIAVLDSNVLTTSQRQAIKSSDHIISEELKALTDKAIAYQKGQGIAVTAADYEKVKSDINAFKGVLATLHAQKSAN
ncbi:MAG: hypothetical protein [Bacteriophage sp.]|nr:MAG: hypothetical protein [Bacteriophage sp.]